MKKRSIIGFGAVLLLFIFSAAAAAAGGHGHRNPKKVGILLVAFGSSEASAQVSFENIDRKVKQAYPGIPVRWAYTSSIILAGSSSSSFIRTRNVTESCPSTSLWS